MIGRFLYAFIQTNLSEFKVTKQALGNGRFNIIATDGYDPKLVFISHMDTVKPSNKQQLKPKLIGGDIYGLGAADMKAGIAACLIATLQAKKTKGLTLIFDCDEEYYFAGIKKLLSQYSMDPRLVVCPEPTNLEIIRGCRGVVEVVFDVIGKTSRAATPQYGVNAIEKAVELVRLLRQKLEKRNDKA